MAYIPERGDIIHLQFDPATGHEMQGNHYALVVSPKAFNAAGLAWVCPISQGAASIARTQGFIVTLMGAGLDTQGAVHCHQLKSLDWKTRKASKKEAAPGYITEEVQARLLAILGES